MSSIRLLIVVDVRLYREGLAASLASRGPFVVVDAVATRAAARAAIGKARPDVVMVDMAVREALDLIHDIRNEPDGAAVVAFAVDEVTTDIVRCAEAGASSYVTAEASLDDLSVAIQGSVSGELICPPHIAGELFRRLGRANTAKADLAHPFLTARERQVLDYVRAGLSNKEIGQRMCLAESTVKNHVHHLLEKLDVRTRAQAAALGGRQITPRGRARSAAV
jgi:two-component system nitrate/nitrite response regulator NarL